MVFAAEMPCPAVAVTIEFVDSTNHKLEALRPRLERICTAMSGEGMFARATRLFEEFRFFEFRLDTVAGPASAVIEMRSFLRQHPEAVAIATCRRTENGGGFEGTAGDELALLHSAADAGAHIIDVSLETAEEYRGELAGLREGPAVLLVSWHDFAGTPDLHAVYKRIQRVQPDLYKIVPTALTLRDSFTLLQLLKAVRNKGNLVAMSMGLAGMATRILGPSYGSLFTFGAPGSGSETAPGQVSSHSMRHLYRIEQITSATRVYGVFGKPIGGSKSPVMLNTAFHATGDDAVYLPLEADAAEELFLCVEQLGLAGASVTMPLKERIMPQLHNLSPLARELGAANTLTREGPSLRGDNTDAVGIVQPMEARIALNGASVLVLGAGGAARAAVHALRSRGADLSICNRTHYKAEQLARDTGAVAVRRSDLATAQFDVILNATPYGMANQQVEAPLLPDEMNCRIFFDMVYNPLEAPLICMARAKGIEVIAGIEMFVTQGAAQFELWTGKAAPVDAMRQAVLASLDAAR